MRLFSHHGHARFILGLIGFLWIVALLFVVTNVSLGCVDMNGCLRSYCSIHWLRPNYQLLVTRNSEKCSR